MKILFLFLISINIFANNLNTINKEEVLATKKIISKEEELALAYENYLLSEFKYPINIDVLKDYISYDNIFKFKINTKLKLEYFLNNKKKKFISTLYNSDLFRKRTLVLDKKYVHIKLLSKEAKNIAYILDQLPLGKIIRKNCDSDSAGFCNKNKTSLRFYDEFKNWIEYSKKDFEKGTVLVSSIDVNNVFKLNKLKRLENLKLGASIIAKDIGEYLKLNNNIFMRIKK